MAIRDIAVGETCRGDKGFIADAHLVMRFIPIAQPTQHLDRVIDRRLLDIDRREAPLQCTILLNILAVLIQGGGADTLQLAARQGRLDHVGGVESALCVACSHDRVELIDEQDILTFGALKLLKDGLQAFLELAPEAGTCDERSQIQKKEPFVFENLGDIIVGDVLSEPLNDRRLADTGLTNEHRVVLGPADKDLNNPLDLLRATDHGIQLVLAGQLRQVPTVALQRPVFALSLRGGQTLPAPHLGNRVLDPLVIDVVVAEEASHWRVLLVGNRQQDVLG